MSTEDVDRLKVHRRGLVLDDTRFTVLSPRPQTDVRFSTNAFREAWHIVCGIDSARFLARILWAMAYQHGSPTIVAIDEEFLVPNPFDAEPSAPIAVINTELATPSTDGFGALRSQLPLSSTPSEGTVRLQTRGLDIAAADPVAYEAAAPDAGDRWNPRQDRSWVRRGPGPGRPGRASRRPSCGTGSRALDPSVPGR